MSDKTMQTVADELVPAIQQFQGRDGAWHNFIDDRHFQNTVEDGSWPLRNLYTQEAIDTLRAQLAEAQREAEVSKQINRACMELPDDFRIAIELERNAACVYLLQEDEDIGSYDPCEGIASSISAAIDAAKGGSNT